MALLRRLSDSFYKKSTLAVLAVAVLLFGFFIGVVLPQEAQRAQEQTGGSRSPDTSFWYSAQDLAVMAESYGPEGRAYYVRSRFSFDLVWPAVYGLFLTASLSFLYRRLNLPVPWRFVNLLPLVAVMLDLAENTAASLFMYFYPRLLPGAAAVAPWFTAGKWIVIGASFLFLFGGIASFFVRRRCRR